LTQQTRGRDVERYAAKWQLARMLYERAWDKQRIVDLFNVIDWMMQIPQQMQSELLDQIDELERGRAMPYISSFERRGLERGLERGRMEGQQQALSALLRFQLARRFGTLPPAIQQRLGQASPAELQAWGEAVLDAPTLDDVFMPR
jgi:flagellar biosynthesis/type III secretory pathway protein FliH